MGAGIISNDFTPQCYAQSGRYLTFNFNGKIGGKYAITVILNILDDNNEISDVYGTYWYGTGKNGKMKLRGYITDLGTIIMNEYDPKGNLCGTWMVNLEFDRNCAYLNGEMENAKGHTYNVHCSSPLR